MSKKKYTFIDLFAGIGGLATGFKWAGILPLIAVEWTDTTAKTYSHNHNTDVFELSKYIGAKGKKDKDYLDGFCKGSDRSILIHGDINLVNNQLIKELLAKAFGEVVEEDKINGSTLIKKKIEYISKEIESKGGRLV